MEAGGTVRSKGSSRKRKEEMKKMEDKGDYTLVEYLSAISRWVGFWFTLFLLDN